MKRHCCTLFCFATLTLLLSAAACQNDASEPGLGEGETAIRKGQDPGSGEPSVVGGGVCTPYDLRPCYTGPAGTEGVGICQAGGQECKEDGSGWQPWCDGDITPLPESCATLEDDDCDGEVNEGCVCLPWDKEPCCLDDGNNVLCRPGVRACATDGLSWGQCQPVGLSCADPAGPPGAHVFSWGFGDGNSVYGNSVATDGDCSVYFTGYYDGTVDLGAGPVTSAGNLGWGDAFFAKLTATGQLIWSKYFSDGQGFQGISPGQVAVDGAGNAILAGNFTSWIDLGAGAMTTNGNRDVYVGKFDGAGNLVWGKHLGGTGNDYAGSVVTDGNGNIYLSGLFEGTANLGAGPLTSAGSRDFFVVKLDPSGATLWSRSFGNAGQDFAPQLTVDGAGNVLVSGIFTGTLDVGGGPLVSAGKEDVLLFKLDASGNHLWSRRFGGSNSDNATSAALDAAGNIILSGRFKGSVDFGGGLLTSAGIDDDFVVKLDSGGNHLWSKRFGDANYQTGGSVAVDAADRVIYVSVSSQGSVDFGGGPLAAGGYVVKLDSSGNHVSSRRYESVGAFKLHASGNMVMTGGYVSPVDFGGGALNGYPPGKQKGFIASFSP
jgi:hypothetical protein